MKLNSIQTLREIDKEYLQTIFNISSSVSEVLIYFGFISQRKDSRKLINKLIIDLNINLDQMHINQKNKLSLLSKNKEHISTIILSNNRFINGSYLLKYLTKYKLIDINCNECGITSTYNNKLITLQVHHIDGNNKNNEISNLMLLCPNCHSQTVSYCGRKNKKELNTCKCGIIINRSSTCCRKCTQENQLINGRSSRKFEIARDELEKLIKTKSMVEIGKMFGVSNTAIKKRCIFLGLIFKK